MENGGNTAVENTLSVEVPQPATASTNEALEERQPRNDLRRASESTSVTVAGPTLKRESIGQQLRRAGSTRSSLTSKPEMEFELPVRDVASIRVRTDVERQVMELKQRLHEEECNTIRLTKQMSAAEDRRIAETSSLYSQLNAAQTSLAALRTQLERSEATRQDLELAVTVVRRDAAENERVALDRAARTERERDELAHVADEAAQTYAEASEQHRSATEAYERQLCDLRVRVDEQDVELQQRNSELLAQSAALSCYEAELRDKNEKLARHEELIGKLQKERVALKKEVRELDESQGREATLQRELETLMSRVDELVGAVHREREENARLRAERQAQEMVSVQLKERCARVSNEKEQIQTAFLRMSDQLGEVKNEYANERCKYQVLVRDFDQLKADYEQALSSGQDSSRRCMETQARLAELQKRVTNSDEANCKLQEELSSARSKSCRSEESCRKMLKQIDALLCTQEQAANDRGSKTKPSETHLQLDSASLASNPTKKSGLLERLRTVLVQYEHELARLRSELRRAEHDATHFRTANSGAQRELGSLKQRLNETQNELLTAQREYATLSERVTELATVSERQAGTFSSESGKLKQAYDALMSVHEKRRADLRNLVAFELDLADQLADLVAATATEPTRRHVPPSRPAALFDANDEAIVALCNQARTSLGDRLAALRSEVTRLAECEADSNMSKRRVAALERRVQQLETVLVEQETSFARERAELEGRVRERGVQDEAMLSEAMQHVTNAARVQTQLEAELRSRDAYTERLRRANGALRFAVALLCSAVPRSRAKHAELAAQKRVLQVEVDRQSAVVNSVMRVVTSLSDTLNTTTASAQAHDSAQFDLDAGRNDRSLMTFSVMRRQEPLLRFRLAAVVVLAANRLRIAARNSVSGGEASWLANLQHVQALALFRNEGLLADLESSLADLVELIDVGAECSKVRADDPQRLADLVRVSNDTLFRKLQHFCNAVQVDEHPRDEKSKPEKVRDGRQKRRGSLVSELKHGLKPLLAQSGTKFGVHILRTDEMGEVLSDLVARLRERFARADSLRQEAVDEASKLREHGAEGDNAARKLAVCEQRIGELERELANRVERCRFERVRNDLEEARAREIELSELLNAQTTSLREMGARLDRVSEFESARERQVRTVSEQCSSLRSALATREGELKARADERTYFEALIADRDRTLDVFARSRTLLSTFVRRIADQIETTRIQLQLRALNCASVSLSTSPSNEQEGMQPRDRDVIAIISSETERLFKELLSETDGRKPLKKRKVDGSANRANSPGTKSQSQSESVPEEGGSRGDDVELQTNSAGLRQMLLAFNEFVQFLVSKYSYFDQQLSELRRHSAFLRDELRRVSKRDSEVRTLALSFADDAKKGDNDTERSSIVQPRVHNDNDNDDDDAYGSDKQKRLLTTDGSKPPSGKNAPDRRTGERKKRIGTGIGTNRSERNTLPDAASARSSSRTRSLKAGDHGDTQSSNL